MMTVRQMQRLWDTRQFNRLASDISAQRIEGLAAQELADHPAIAAAAWGLIRLEELNQPQAPLCRILINTLLARQEPDGGWGMLPSRLWSCAPLPLEWPRPRRSIAA